MIYEVYSEDGERVHRVEHLRHAQSLAEKSIRELMGDVVVTFGRWHALGRHRYQEVRVGEVVLFNVVEVVVSYLSEFNKRG